MLAKLSTLSLFAAVTAAPDHTAAMSTFSNVTGDEDHDLRVALDHIIDAYQDLNRIEKALVKRMARQVISGGIEHALVVNRLEANAGLPASLFLEALSLDIALEESSRANTISQPEGQQQFIDAALDTPWGAMFAFNQPKAFAAQLLAETSLARYLDTRDGGLTYNILCGTNATNPVVKALFDGDYFNALIPTPLENAQIDLKLNTDTGVLEVTENTSEEDVNLVLGCLVSAEEVYHAGLHFIEGTFQYAVSTGTLADDLFLESMLNMQQVEVQEKYAEVYFLAVAPTVVFSKAIPINVMTSIISAALVDFTSLYPLSNIPEARLESFAGPLQDIYQQILATDFGYGDATIDVYVSKDITVAASINNLLQLQLMVALMHTDTFVWQQFGAVAPEFTDLMSALVSASILNSVVFPDVEECVSTSQDASVQYAQIVDESPAGVASTALEGYASWLSAYRASGLTGFASAFSESQCMSSTTWV